MKVGRPGPPRRLIAADPSLALARMIVAKFYADAEWAKAEHQRAKASMRPHASFSWGMNIIPYGGQRWTVCDRSSRSGRL